MSVDVNRREIKAELRLRLYFLLEKINMLEDFVQKGESAREELKDLEEQLKELCKKIAEE